MDRQEQESAAANSFIHAWTAFFERQRDNRDPPVNNNASGQQQWWSALGRTLAWVLGNIADRNDPPLQMPPRQL
jgi:hypothetical protein